MDISSSSDRIKNVTVLNRWKHKALAALMKKNSLNDTALILKVRKSMSERELLILGELFIGGGFI